MREFRLKLKKPSNHRIAFALKSLSSNQFFNDFAINIKRFIFAILFLFSRRLNSSTFNNFLLNIFCSLSRKKRFYCRNCCNFDCDTRNCSIIINYVTFIFIFFCLNFVKARSITLKFITKMTNSHFLFIRMHSTHFRNKNNN